MTATTKSPKFVGALDEHIPFQPDLIVEQLAQGDTERVGINAGRSKSKNSRCSSIITG